MSHYVENIMVVGCGKLGLPLVAILAEAGHKVVAFDNNVDLIDTLSKGSVPWYEVGLENLIRKHSKSIKYTSALNDETNQCSLVLVIVPTPSNNEGRFDSSYVENVILEITKQRLNSNAGPVTIVIISTLMPGATSEIQRQMQGLVGSRVNDFGLVYSPEFIALGSVIQDMKNPALVLIGTNNEASANRYRNLVQTYALSQPHYAILSFESAEIAKIGVNSFVTMKISFANFISELCELEGNASANEVLDAIGSDKRIGRAYLKPGTPFGGPCFPRDNVALARFGESLGVSSSIPIAIHEFNEAQVDRIVRAIDNFFPRDLTVLLVGLAYKPGTAVTEESASLKVMRKLERKRQVLAIDSFLSVQNLFPSNFINEEDLKNLTVGAVLMVPDQSYEKIPEVIGSESYFLDCWGSWSGFSEVFSNRYRRLGEITHDQK